MTDRKTNFFHSRRVPAARLVRSKPSEGADAAAEAPAAAKPERKPLSLFHSGPNWLPRRAPGEAE